MPRLPLVLPLVLLLPLLMLPLGARADQELDSLIALRHQRDTEASLNPSTASINPYLFHLLTPPVVWPSSLKAAFRPGWQGGAADSCLRLSHVSDSLIALTSAHSPSLFPHTGAEVARTYRRLPGDSLDLSPQGREMSLVEAAPLPLDAYERLAEDLTQPVFHRPRMWTLRGEGSLQFTQNYFSENWYQGGEKNYAALSSITLEACFDNHRRLQWDNKLEVQLGFQTSSDTVHRAKVTSNLLRHTSNLRIEAAHNWYYTASAVTYTQLCRYYDENAYTYSTAFASPLDFTLAVGMTYTFSVAKDRIEGSLMLSPIAYNMRYVGCDSLREHYAIDEGKKAWNNFGPSLTFNLKVKPCDNILWESRLYYFTNLSYVNIEWENTLTFTINRFLSAKAYVYPRFDDSSDAYRGPHGFLMLKEWFSLGLGFTF